MHQVRKSVGAIALCASLQYFVAEFVTASAWRFPEYEWGLNFISDLGVPECLTLADRTVCSPWSSLMNTAFVVQGVLVLVAVSTLTRFVSNRLRAVAAVLFLVHAVGIVMVGLFPGSTVDVIGGDATRAHMHSLGALLAIGFGNVAILTTGFLVLRQSKALAAGSLLAGAVGLAAIALMTSGIELGLGQGGIERVAVDPIIVWMIGTGLVALIHTRRRVPVEAPLVHSDTSPG